MARRRRKKKAEFEMLIISFCDIITISTAALLLALFVTVQLAIKIPVFRPTPRSAPSSKQAFFFECRNDHLFFVDKAGLDEQVEELMSKLNSGVRGGDLGSFQKAIQGQEVGNPYYKYQAMLSLLDKDKQYIAFLVRDDSFNVFRKARQVADSLGLDTGWELLGIDEQINFGEGGIAIGTQ